MFSRNLNSCLFFFYDLCLLSSLFMDLHFLDSFISISLFHGFNCNLPLLLYYLFLFSCSSQHSAMIEEFSALHKNGYLVLVFQLKCIKLGWLLRDLKTIIMTVDCYSDCLQIYLLSKDQVYLD